MCEGYFKKLCREAGLDDVEASSAGVFAGTGERASEAARRALKEHGVDLSQHRSRTLDKPMLDAADLIVAMGSGHRAHIGRLSPHALRKTKLLLDYADKAGADVPDPFGGGADEYMHCFSEMKPALENLLLEVLKERGSKHS